MNKREEERNEKIIRGLMKLPPNRRCINCNSLGPQYVCTTFWTFVCMTCSGIHREFTHRVKSVSMAKFTKQEVEALQNGGNQRAREIFLKDWDMQRMRLPDSSHAERIREFIRNVYVNKKYAGARSSDRPPEDIENFKNHEEQRRASSYHSYSQSPPYDNQYEDRRYGKQTGMPTRRLGSDRGLASYIYSPGRLRELTFEDRFANETSGSRLSDFSVSSAGDQFRHDGHSPNSQDAGYCSPSSRQLKDILDEDARSHVLSRYNDANVKREFDRIPPPKRTASASSFGSIASNPRCRTLVDSSGQVDVVQEPVHPTGTLQAVAAAVPSVSSSASIPATNQKFSSQPFVQLSMPSTAPSIDLFADMNSQSSFTPLDKKPSTVPSGLPPENGGWATFDLPHHTGLASGTQMGISAVVPPSNETCKGSVDASTSSQSNSRWFSVQNSVASGLFSQTSGQWHVGVQENKSSADTKSSESWSTFDDSTGSTSLTLFESLPQDNRSQFSAPESSGSGNPNVGLKVSQDFVKDEFEEYSLPDTAPGLVLPLRDMVGLSFPPPSVHPFIEGVSHARKSTNPFDLPYNADQDANSAFLDMSSLQSALPNPQSPTYLDGLARPWFPQTSATAYVPALAPGGLACIPGQAPSSQLLNLPQQSPIASLGGNPFS